jgi:hypothetical protein
MFYDMKEANNDELFKHATLDQQMHFYYLL